MATNKSFTGGRRAVGTPTLGKAAMFQLIRKAREANKGADNARVRRRTPDR